MIFRVCPCHGRKVIPRWTHDRCDVTGEKVEAREVDTTAPRAPAPASATASATASDPPAGYAF